MPSSEALAERAGGRAFLPPLDGAGSLRELYYLCPRSEKAQMAESVDALVSNTNGRKFVPVRSRLWVQPPRLTALKCDTYKVVVFVADDLADDFYLQCWGTRRSHTLKISPEG